MKYYLAYGSNLNIKQMQMRCPGAKPVGTTVLEGYELLFKGSKTGSYLTIEKKMNQAKNGTLQNATANLVLSGSIAFWDDRHSEGRKWLERLEDEQPEKAQMIQNILLKDMRFQDLEAKKDYSQFLKVGIPVGGAVVGFAISKGTGAALPVQTLLTAGLALVGYPVASNMAAAARDTAEKNAIDAYMHQLEKYKLSVENILNI